MSIARKQQEPVPAPPKAGPGVDENDVPVVFDDNGSILYYPFTSEHEVDEWLDAAFEESMRELDAAEVQAVKDGQS